MNAHVFLGGTAALIQIALAIIVLVKNHRKKENKLFSLLLLLFFFSSMGETIGAYQGTSSLSIKLLFIPAIMLFYMFSYFTAVFPTKQSNAPIIKSKTNSALFALPGLYLVFLLLTDNFFASYEAINEGFIIEFGKNEFIIKGIFIGYLLLTLSNLSNSQKKAQTAIQARRLRYTFVAMLLPIAAGSITIALSKIFLGGQTVYLFSLFPLLGIIMSLILTYTILKYNLMGIDLIFSIGLVYTLTTTVLAGCMELIQEVMEDVFDASDGWEQAITVLVIAAVFSPIKDTLTRFIDKFFGKKDLNTLKTLQVIIENLRSQPSFDQLFNKLKEEVTMALDVESIDILPYPDQEEKLLSNFPKKQNDMDELIFYYNNNNDKANEDRAVIFKEKGIKLYFAFQGEDSQQWHLLLGPKTSKVPYTQEETDIIQGLIKEVPHIMAGLKMIEKVVHQEKTAQEIEIANNLLKAIAHKPGSNSFYGYKTESFVYLSAGIKGDMIEVNENRGYIAVYDAFHSGVKAVTTLNIIYSVLNTDARPMKRLNEANSILKKFENQELSCATTMLNLHEEELELYNHGNPSPLIIMEKEAQIALPSLVEPIGLLPELKTNKTKVKLEENQLLLLTTNGLHKVFEDLIKEPLEDFLQKNLFKNAKDCRDKLAAVVTEKVTKDFNDDITFIVVGLK